MKKLLSLLLCAALLTGCGSNVVPESTGTAPISATASPPPAPITQDYISRFDYVTRITLSDEGILVDDLDNGNKNLDSVFVTHDIIFYENRDVYESGNPYGEGTDADKHTAEEAAAHTVVNITKPGAYRIDGSLSAGQLRIDLGEDACDDPDAVVELILHNADITCTVAPAIVFLNTYECDGSSSAETARPDVDTSAAGANLILEGNNTVSGSYVAKIFKDKDGEKKLWKQDGAIYSYMSMNVFGPGALVLNAANEGLDTELHLTLYGGDITIHSQNDGINTNEDGVSVTTINGGNLTIFAGLGAEGDGIDSNGYLVINGGIVFASAKPASDAGLDSDLGSFIHGGTVVAMGSAMDWAESDSGQVTLNLQFASQQPAGTEIRLTAEDGSDLFSFTPKGEHVRGFTGLILSAPSLKQGKTCHVYIDGVLMAYTGTDVRRGPGGFVGRPGRLPEDFDPEQVPEDVDPVQKGDRGFRPDGGQMAPPENISPEAMVPPEAFDGKFPGGMEPPEGKLPEHAEGGHPAEPSTAFYMHDMVNFFSGITAAVA